jgi:hypothetical protein
LVRLLISAEKSRRVGEKLPEIEKILGGAENET